MSTKCNLEGRRLPEKKVRGFSPLPAPPSPPVCKPCAHTQLNCFILCRPNQEIRRWPPFAAVGQSRPGGRMSNAEAESGDSERALSAEGDGSAEVRCSCLLAILCRRMCALLHRILSFKKIICRFFLSVMRSLSAFLISHNLPFPFHWSPLLRLLPSVCLAGSGLPVRMVPPASRFVKTRSVPFVALPRTSLSFFVAF